MINNKFPLYLLLLALCGCASVITPNTGELRSDELWEQKQYDEALAIIEPAAQAGLPWAQLRLGIAYEYGQGKQQDYLKAIEWYKKTAGQSSEDAWSDGLPLLSAGVDGFFNQNNDALVAQYLIARIWTDEALFSQNQLAEAWLMVNHIIVKKNDSDILYCCENSSLGEQTIENERIIELRNSIENKLGPQDLTTLKKRAVYWTPQKHFNR